MYRSENILVSKSAGDQVEVKLDDSTPTYPVDIKLRPKSGGGMVTVSLDLELAEELASQLEDLLRPGRLDQEADARLGRDSTGASASDLDESYQRALAGGA